MKIRDHRLILDDGIEVPFRRSPNQGGAMTPEYLVMHFTRGASADSSLRWLTDSKAKASAHLLIARDGGVTQMVAFDRVAWHAGRSSWAGRRGLNNFAIGIELDNQGDLLGTAGAWRNAWGQPVPDEEVVELPHKFDRVMRGWHIFTEPQLDIARRIAAVLVRHYGLKDVIGHDDISPGRKIDPGPDFPMASFRAVAGETICATTTTVNIRSGPGTKHPKLDAGPLPAGTRVEILAQRGRWCHVDVLDTVHGEMDLVGWVHERYLRSGGDDAQS